MEFRTVINVKRSPVSISHQSSVIMIGSCFTENIGGEMNKEFFPVTINPTGVLYNPASIASSLDDIMSGRVFHTRGLVKDNAGTYHSMSHHSSFSSSDPIKVVQNLNRAALESKICLSEADVLIVTFGTAKAYRYKDSGEIVANCHKIPQSEFDIVNLSSEEIESMWFEVITRLMRFNPQLKIIFTISPIRYKAYGYHGSQLDKAVLLTAVDNIINCFDDTTVTYFPSYEIMLDDLRDYRFYSPDMIHPSQQAIEYIYGKFREAFYDDHTLSLALKARQLSSRLSHRFLTDNQSAKEAFYAETHNIIEGLSDEIPSLVNYNIWQDSVPRK